MHVRITEEEMFPVWYETQQTTGTVYEIEASVWQAYVEARKTFQECRRQVAHVLTQQDEAEQESRRP